MGWNRKAPALIALFALAACDTETPTAVSDTPDFAVVTASSDAIPDRYIIRLSDDVPSAAAASEAMMRGVRGDVHFTYENVFKGFAATLPGASLAAIQRNPLVASIEADGVVTMIATTQTGATWGLDRIDARSGLDDEYSYGVTGDGVDAYILDTGILSTHVDFGSRVDVAKGYDAFRDDGSVTEDCNGHGTHVAGTVGGTQWGVAKAVTLIPVRVLDCNGSGSFSGVIAGMDHVAETAAGPSVANMSLGGGFSSSVNAAVTKMHDAGVTVVVAAGNSTADACNSSPASAPAAITVGSTTSSDDLAGYSNYGSCVDISAPGSGITSAWHTGNAATNTISGTSMASPHVAGAAALWLETGSVSGPDAVATKLVETATPNAIGYCRRVTGGGPPRTECGLPSGTPNLLLYVDPGMTSGGGGGGGDPTNSPPTASFTYSCDDLTCTFTGSANDADDDALTYEWNFGDGSSATTLNPTHTYLAYDNFTVTLTVHDGQATGSASETVTTVDPSAVLTVQYITGKRRGYHGIEIQSISSGSPGSLTMFSRVTGTTYSVNPEPFVLGTFYTTPEKGGATYDITVCNVVGLCSEFVVVY